MTAPFFYIKHLDESQKTIELDEDTSRHIVQVLRMKDGDRLNLTDGKGHLISAEIINGHKKHCEVKTTDSRFTPHDSRHITIAISLLKNSNRFEWFLEKATELGIWQIIPLICDRTEKEKFRYDRMQGIVVSAMLQSQQVWLPLLEQPRTLRIVIGEIGAEQKFIASCDPGLDRKTLSTINLLNSITILIGPEGDFTNDETRSAVEYGFLPVSLGENRLRTETAGVVAACLLSV